jgi:hypothetical protein
MKNSPQRGTVGAQGTLENFGMRHDMKLKTLGVLLSTKRRPPRNNRKRTLIDESITEHTTLGG